MFAWLKRLDFDGCIFKIKLRKTSIFKFLRRKIYPFILGLEVWNFRTKHNFLLGHNISNIKEDVKRNEKHQLDFPIPLAKKNEAQFEQPPKLKRAKVGVLQFLCFGHLNFQSFSQKTSKIIGTEWKFSQWYIRDLSQRFSKWQTNSTNTSRDIRSSNYFPFENEI